MDDKGVTYFDGYALLCLGGLPPQAQCIMTRSVSSSHFLNETARAVKFVMGHVKDIRRNT